MTPTVPMLRWGLVFLHCPLPLDEEQKVELVKLAATAYFEDRDALPLDLPGLRGEVRATSETTALGGFVGQRFEAEVHLTDGTSAVLRFLVTEAQLNAAWKAWGALRQPMPVAEA